MGAFDSQLLRQTCSENNGLSVANVLLGFDFSWAFMAAEKQRKSVYLRRLRLHFALLDYSLLKCNFSSVYL